MTEQPSFRRDSLSAKPPMSNPRPSVGPVGPVGPSNGTGSLSQSSFRGSLNGGAPAPPSVASTPTAAASSPPRNSQQSNLSASYFNPNSGANYGSNSNPRGYADSGYGSTVPYRQDPQIYTVCFLSF